jgi:hypothetical protein
MTDTYFQRRVEAILEGELLSVFPSREVQAIVAHGRMGQEQAKVIWHQFMNPDEWQNPEVDASRSACRNADLTYAVMPKRISWSKPPVLCGVCIRKGLLSEAEMLCEAQGALLALRWGMTQRYRGKRVGEPIQVSFDDGIVVDGVLSNYRVIPESREREQQRVFEVRRSEDGVFAEYTLDVGMKILYPAAVRTKVIV